MVSEAILFALIGGKSILKKGLRFLFWVSEVPDLSVRKGPLSLSKLPFSSLSDQALPVP